MTDDLISTPPVNDDQHKNKIIALALQQAQKQLENGTATSQTLAHFLKQGDPKYAAELKKIELETELIEEKIRSEKAKRDLESDLEEVFNALKSYTVPDAF